ncbi:arginyltransferase [Inmirania thermothiophila]|uniref:Aspartate/glutamate leucyltransferase n=1 Tax=Inmirania thermothiophila TaxID=1750597 RepID=A0A3N1Y1B6_9GAMM|nr:arginyltransferase [Inmirania thermothiophila]ROR32615.1 arginine-tRNA-protein transferase [Inmirania thermothiophila]
MTGPAELAALLPAPLFLSGPQPCGYLPDRKATHLFTDPGPGLEPARYGRLLALGFRRSGAFLYRPHCFGCDACVPVRVPAGTFRPRRWARRTLERNRDLQRTLGPAAADAEHLDLYNRYLAWRHPGGTMACADAAEYRELLLAPWAETVELAFRLAGRLVAVAVTDRTADALSAVYTYYDPALAPRGLGTLAILEQLRLAREQGLPWVYLGYWIEGHAKMGYKARFRPLERLGPGGWVPLAPDRGGDGPR